VRLVLATHSLERLVQLGNLLGTGQLGGPAGRVVFDHAPQFRQIGQVLARNLHGAAEELGAAGQALTLADEHPLPVPDADQADCLQAANPLPQGIAADSQPLDQLGFGRDAVAGREPAFVDQRAESFHDFIDE
jgi:hypothetical protein